MYEIFDSLAALFHYVPEHEHRTIFDFGTQFHIFTTLHFRVFQPIAFGYLRLHPFSMWKSTKSFGSANEEFRILRTKKKTKFITENSDIGISSFSSFSSKMRRCGRKSQSIKCVIKTKNDTFQFQVVER